MAVLSLIEGATITGNGTDVVLFFGSNGTFNGNTIGFLRVTRPSCCVVTRA